MNMWKLLVARQATHDMLFDFSTTGVCGMYYLFCGMMHINLITKHFQLLKTTHIISCLGYLKQVWVGWTWKYNGPNIYFGAAILFRWVLRLVLILSLAYIEPPKIHLWQRQIPHWKSDNSAFFRAIIWISEIFCVVRNRYFHIEPIICIQTVVKTAISLTCIFSFEHKLYLISLVFDYVEQISDVRLWNVASVSLWTKRVGFWFRFLLALKLNVP